MWLHVLAQAQQCRVPNRVGCWSISIGLPPVDPSVTVHGVSEVGVCRPVEPVVGLTELGQLAEQPWASVAFPCAHEVVGGGEQVPHFDGTTDARVAAVRRCGNRGSGVSHQFPSTCGDGGLVTTWPPGAVGPLDQSAVYESDRCVGGQHVDCFSVDVAEGGVVRDLSA